MTCASARARSACTSFAPAAAPVGWSWSGAGRRSAPRRSPPQHERAAMHRLGLDRLLLLRWRVMQVVGRTAVHQQAAAAPPHPAPPPQRAAHAAPPWRCCFFRTLSTTSTTTRCQRSLTRESWSCQRVGRGASTTSTTRITWSSRAWDGRDLSTHPLEHRAQSGCTTPPSPARTMSRGRQPSVAPPLPSSFAAAAARARRRWHSSSSRTSRRHAQGGRRMQLGGCAARGVWWGVQGLLARAAPLRVQHPPTAPANTPFPR